MPTPDIRHRPEPRVLRADDPAVARLLDGGARLVSESWGARLTVDAAAVKGAAVLALAAQEHTRFGTGGAEVNAGSRRANETLGYTVVERWLHLLPAGA